MKYFSGIILVEGKNDASFLSSFIDSEYVVLNGYEINDSTINYLSHIEKSRKIILFADPDEGGDIIRKNFSRTGLVYDTVVLDINSCNKHNKHGVAECNKQEVLTKLNQYLSDSCSHSIKITAGELAKIGIFSSTEETEYVKTKLNLGVCNFKTFVKRLNYNNISIETVKELLLEKYGNK